MIIRILVILVFMTAAGLLWWPFDTYNVLYATRPGGAVPAGEIQAGFRLSQTLTPPAAVGDDAADPAGQHCVSIRFATYARTNDGHLDVHWSQGPKQQSWRVAMADLVDNSYRFFCPDVKFVAYEPFDIRIAGVDGEPGASATLWLVSDKRFGNAHISGDSAGKTVALQVGIRHRVTSTTMLHLGNGAFLIGWLCTVAIGLLALGYGFGDSVRRRAAIP